MVSADPPSKASVKSKPQTPITIIHFNDVYNVEEQPVEPVAGAARFSTAIKSFQDRDPLILFSGDIFAPSIMSTFTLGEQMIPVINHLGVHCAVYGNHDFDFGLDRLIELSGKTDCCPWLMSNVTDKETDRPLAEGCVTKIIDWHGWKIGLIGLVESEWLDTLSTINPEEVIFTDYSEKGTELAKELRDQGCDYIIALTHMRTPNDVTLAENVNGIDLILGGHDHVYECQQVNGKYILKSGTDFREFSVVTLTPSEEETKVDIERIEVNSSFSPDEELKKSLQQYENVVNEKMDQKLCDIGTELDGRFSKIRTSETNLGNLLCDVLMAATGSDVALINSGTFRSDRIHPKGQFTMRDLMSILPMLDAMCVLQVTGTQLLDALENGISQYPKLEGRFPQVAGVEFAFNPDKAPGSRLFRDIVKVGDEYVDPESNYRLITKNYLRTGRDGYKMLVDCPVLQDEEQCPRAPTALQNHFKAIQSKLGKGKRNSTHRQSLILLSRRHSLIRGHDHFSSLENLAKHRLGRSASVELGTTTHRPRLMKQESVEEIEMDACNLTPRVDGRIICTNDENVEKLRQTRKFKRVPTIDELDEPSTPRSLKESIFGFN